MVRPGRMRGGHNHHRVCYYLGDGSIHLEIAVSRSTAFKMAHQLTRSHRAHYPEDDYRLMFGLFLSQIQRPTHTTAAVRIAA